MPPDKQSLLDLLEPTGQTHLVAFWEELDTRQQVDLAAQIKAVDLPLIASLYADRVNAGRVNADRVNADKGGLLDWAKLSRRATAPPAVRLAERESNASSVLESGLETTNAAASHRGAQTLGAGKVGVILTAGGQGSRLGFELPKSLYPIGPLSSATLLQIHIEKIRAIAARYDVSIPLYLMTSPATHEDTIRFLNENQNFGLASSDLIVFCQGTMPAVDIETGQLLLAEKGRLFLSPDGHGGTIAGLEASGAIDHMQQRGVEQLFYLQVDNPLVPICDPALLGYHLLAESELTSLAVAKQQAQDKLGNFAMIDGQLHVIEYSDLPEDVAELRDEQGELKFWAGSIAVHIFERSLLERSLKLSAYPRARLEVSSGRESLNNQTVMGRAVKKTLPFHIAQKNVPHINASGEQVTPSGTNALKFEKFIFDLLPAADRPIVVEYAEEECFAPLKNAPGAEKDTAEYVQQRMLAQHRRWLVAAGAKLPAGVDVEISPLYALDATGVAEQIQHGQQFEESTYLKPPV